MKKKLYYKVFFSLFALLAIIFYDISIPLINFVIQLKINLLGFFLEPLLQWAFDVSLRQAQVIAAWIYLLISLFLFGYFIIRVSQSFLTNIYAIRQFWFALNSLQKIGHLILAIVLFVAILKAAFLFF